MLWTTANGGTRKYITGKLSVSSRDAMKSQISADGSTIVFQSDADFRSEGSCYSMTTHQVTCNIAASACTSPNVHYAPGFVSSRNGCCHCVAGCDHTKETGANCAASYGQTNVPNIVWKKTVEKYGQANLSAGCHSNFY